jgi:hypothetical protein
MSSLSPRTLQFLTWFYQLSDTSPAGNPKAHQNWVEAFSTECYINFAGKVLRSPDDLLLHRTVGWQNVTARLHVLQEVFAGDDGKLMLNGAWEYDGVDGVTTKGTWAGMMHLIEDDQGFVGLKIKEYRTWIVSTGHLFDAGPRINLSC